MAKAPMAKKGQDTGPVRNDGKIPKHEGNPTKSGKIFGNWYKGKGKGK